MTQCNCTFTMDDVKILATSTCSEANLLTLEAIMIGTHKPSLNTKDEFKSRTLTIKKNVKHQSNENLHKKSKHFFGKNIKSFLAFPDSDIL